MKQQRWRTPIAFFLAPVLPCAAVTLTLSALSGQWNGLLFGFAAMLIVCEALTAALAVPAYLALKRFYKVHLAQCVLAGMLVGLTPSLIGAFTPTSSGYSSADSGGHTIINGKLTPHGFVVEVQGAAFRSVLGGVIGACFWVLALYRRPGYPASNSSDVGA
jgi:hypothetical protein